jgi:hypothetical protein
MKTHHLLIDGLGSGVPALIVLHVPMVAMVLAVAHPPAVVRHQDAGMADVPHKVVDVSIVAEALMSTAKQNQQTICQDRPRICSKNLPTTKTSSISQIHQHSYSCCSGIECKHEISSCMQQQRL